MERQLTFKTVRYGMLVEVLHEDGSGYHAGCKVHFFNRKGVLVGNYYEFLPYERLRIREEKSRYYPRYFYGKRMERIKSWLFKIPLRITDRLLRFTQSKMK